MSDVVNSTDNQVILVIEHVQCTRQPSKASIVRAMNEDLRGVCVALGRFLLHFAREIAQERAHA